MKKVLALLVVLGILSLPSIAQGPSPPSVGEFSPDGATVEMATWVRLSCSYSDPDDDLWRVALYVTGPHEDYGFDLAYDDLTGQISIAGQSCSPGQNAVAEGVVTLDCEGSSVEIDTGVVTATWKIVNRLYPGAYAVTAQVLDKTAQIDHKQIGTFNSIAAVWPYGF